jgi:hypothetical protein
MSYVTSNNRHILYPPHNPHRDGRRAEEIRSQCLSPTDAPRRPLVITSLKCFFSRLPRCPGTEKQEYAVRPEQPLATTPRWTSNTQRFMWITKENTCDKSRGTEQVHSSSNGREQHPIRDSGRDTVYKQWNSSWFSSASLDKFRVSILYRHDRFNTNHFQFGTM